MEFGEVENWLLEIVACKISNSSTSLFHINNMKNVLRK